MKLADHNTNPTASGDLGGPTVIGGGGFAFYQTRLTTANPGMKGTAGSYFMQGKPITA